MPTKPPGASGLLSIDETDPLDQLLLPASPPLPQQGTELLLPTGHRLPISSEHAQMLDSFVQAAPQAAQALADAVSGLFPAPEPIALPARKISDPNAGALAGGVLLGLGRKYKDENLTSAGAWLGDAATAAWRPSKPAATVSKSPRTQRQERRSVRQRKRRQKKS
jgi:hypothetical protein